MYNIARGLVGKGDLEPAGKVGRGPDSMSETEAWKTVEKNSPLLTSAEHPPRQTLHGEPYDLPNAAQLRAAEPGLETSVRPQPTPSPLFLKSCK